MPASGHLLVSGEGGAAHHRRWQPHLLNRPAGHRRVRHRLLRSRFALKLMLGCRTRLELAISFGLEPPRLLPKVLLLKVLVDGPLVPRVVEPYEISNALAYILDPNPHLAACPTHPVLDLAPVAGESDYDEQANKWANHESNARRLGCPACRPEWQRRAAASLPTARLHARCMVVQVACACPCNAHPARCALRLQQLHPACACNAARHIPDPTSRPAAQQHARSHLPPDPRCRLPQKELRLPALLLG